MEIYWFSGTGNSLAVARDLAEKTGAKLKPLAPLANAETIHSPAEAIGLVFPVYDFKAPKIIDDFIIKFEGLEDKYLFVLCTYGISPLKCLVRLQRKLAVKGCEIQAGFALMMPHNAVGNSEFTAADRQTVLKKAKMRVSEIAEIVNKRQSMPVEAETMISALLFRGLFFKVVRPVVPLLLHAARHGWESLAFTVTDNCSGCTTCSKVCPVNNITIVKDRPVWGDNCLSCFACIQWCSREAIQLGTGQIRVERYHHPEIKSSDINIIVSQNIQLLNNKFCR